MRIEGWKFIGLSLIIHSSRRSARRTARGAPARRGVVRGAAGVRVDRPTRSPCVPTTVGSTRCTRASMQSVTPTPPWTGATWRRSRRAVRGGAGSVVGGSAPEHHQVGGQVPGRARARRDRAATSAHQRPSHVLPAAHHVTSVRGIPITTGARHCSTSPRAPEDRLRRAVRQAQFLKLTRVRSLGRCYTGRGRTRPQEFAQVLATGAAPTQSELEDVVLDLILRGGFAHATRRIRRCTSRAAGSSPDFPGPSSGS